MIQLNNMTITPINSNIPCHTGRNNQALRLNNDNVAKKTDNMGTYFEFQQASSSMNTNKTAKVQSVRALSITEKEIITTINNAFKNWFQPWKDTYLNDGEEFGAIYDTMEALIHYEEQIALSDSVLANERLDAISRAVARFIDYGNAILGIDIIIRHHDARFHELDPTQVTTIELFQAHIRAQKLRDKLLIDYFKRETSKRFSSDRDSLSSTSTSNLSGSLQIPLQQTSSNMPSPILERSHRMSSGSNISINTLIPVVSSTVSDSSYASGRRTPSQSFTHLFGTQSFIELRQPDATIYNTLKDNDLSDSQLELKHIMATIRSSAFADAHNSNSRLAFLPGILEKIESLMMIAPTNQPEKLSHCFELLSSLLNVIEELPVESRKEEVQVIAKKLLKPLVRKVYVDDRENFVDFQHSHWATYLLSLIRLMTASDLNIYLRRNFPILADLSAFLKDFLFIVKRFIALKRDTGLEVHEPIYPTYWIEMSLWICSTLLRSMIYLYQTLKQCFASNLPIWNSYIDCLIHFILHDSLKPNRPMFKARQSMLANDLRKTSADYVWIVWDSLDHEQKQQILEDLLEPLLRCCMILEPKQRVILLPIFHDMMRCDYTCQYIAPRGGNTSGTLTSGTQPPIFEDEFLSANFIYDDDLDGNMGFVSNDQFVKSRKNSSYNTRPEVIGQNSGESLPCLSIKDQINSSSDDGTVLTRFTHLIVGKLNHLMVDLDLGDKQFKDDLCSAISGLIEAKYDPNYHASHFYLSHNDDQFKHMAKQTSNLIAEFMQICLDLRQASHLSYNHLYLLCLFKMVSFFRDKVDRIELYLINLLKLWSLHHKSGRYVEAGFTLFEHATSIPWSNEPLESHYRIITSTMQTPEPLTDLTSLKIFLYTTIIKYFDEAQSWEAAIPLCRELIDIHQFSTYHYDKLADVLAKLSEFFDSIITNNKGFGRAHPTYFRVSFYGLGFPESIRNSTMVYRGKPYETLSDFQSSLLSNYSDITLLKTMSKPDDESLQDPNSRYILINACKPIVDLKSKFNVENIKKIPDPILEYYRRNECDKFEFDRKINRNELSTPAIGLNEFANIWRERTTLVTNSLPGMLPFFPVFLVETSIISPIECAIEDLISTNDRLSCMVNRFKADKRHEEDVRPLGQLLSGIVNAAVNGGITKYEEAFFERDVTATTKAACLINHQPQHQQQQDQAQVPLTLSSLASSLESNFAGQLSVSSMACNAGQQQQYCTGTMFANQNEDPDQRLASADQVKKLKTLIAHQVPLLDEAIRLHRERVADIMRPQHEHLEATYKTLKQHIMSKYARYLPSDYSRSTSIRSSRLVRSPNRSRRLESTAQQSLPNNPSSLLINDIDRLSTKLLSDVGNVACLSSRDSGVSAQDEDLAINATSIPYRQLQSERRSLPFLTGVSAVNRAFEDQAMCDSPTPGQAASTGRQSKQLLVDSDASDQEPATQSSLRRTYSNQTTSDRDSIYSTPPPLPPPRSSTSSSSMATISPPAPKSDAREQSPYVCVTDLLRKTTLGSEGDLPYSRLDSRRKRDIQGIERNESESENSSNAGSSNDSDHDQQQQHQLQDNRRADYVSDFYEELVSSAE